jgi:hypothetical protein
VVFFKLMLVGRLENIASGHRLVEHCALRLDILYWHSTISRTRQLYPAAIFEHLFAQYVAARLVAGDTQTVDSACIKANASLDSLCEEPVGRGLMVVGQAVPPLNTAGAAIRAAPAHQLRYEAAHKPSAGRKPAAH